MCVILRKYKEAIRVWVTHEKLKAQEQWIEENGLPVAAEEHESMKHSNIKSLADEVSVLYSKRSDFPLINNLVKVKRPKHIVDDLTMKVTGAGLFMGFGDEDGGDEKDSNHIRQDSQSTRNRAVSESANKGHSHRRTQGSVMDQFKDALKLEHDLAELKQHQFGSLSNPRLRKHSGINLYVLLHRNSEFYNAEQTGGLNNAGDDIAVRMRSELPLIFHYFDSLIHGEPIFEFVIKSLLFSEDKFMWSFFNHLVVIMPTPIVLRLIKQFEDSFHRFGVNYIDDFMKCVILSSEFPSATALYCAGMVREFFDYDTARGKQLQKISDNYVRVAKVLLSSIEDFHLLGYLCLVPSNAQGLTLFDIALKFHLTNFMDFHTLQPLINRLWETPDVLDPRPTHSSKERNYQEIMLCLWNEPALYYFSAQGIFTTSSVAYLAYLLFFSYISYLKIYPYEPYSEIEFLLWFLSFGYCSFELVQLFFERHEYFLDLSNYFDIFIVLNWFVLFALRVSIRTLAREKDLDDQFKDENSELSGKWRNRTSVVIYQIIWGVLLITFWSRSVMVVQRPASLNGLIKVMNSMVKDIKNFAIILTLLTIGFIFAIHFLISDDITEVQIDNDGNERVCVDSDNDEELHGFAQIMVYMYQTLMGQQEWDPLSSDNSQCINRQRAAALTTIIILYGIIAVILLLNLLIGIMASTYDAMTKVERSEIIFARIKNTLKIHNEYSLMPMPGNAVTFTIHGFLLVIQIAVWLCSARRLVFQIIDYFPFDVAMTDELYAANHDSELMDPNAISSPSLIPGESFSTLKAPIPKRRILRRNRNSNLSFSSPPQYCRYCRRRTAGVGAGPERDVATYTDLLAHKYEIDESDIGYIQHIAGGQSICNHCFRPIKSKRLLYEWQVEMEIISYVLFWIIFRPILLVMYGIPTLLGWITDWLRSEISQDGRGHTDLSAFTAEYKIGDTVSRKRIVAEYEFNRS